MAIAMEQWQKENDCKIDWYDLSMPKYYIRFNFQTDELVIDCTYYYKIPGVVYFSSVEIARKARDIFRIELMHRSGRITKTGYERVDKNKYYYYMNWNCSWSTNTECGENNNDHYNNGNYYNDITLAANNCRVDKLMSQMRQWQALNDKPIRWWELDNVTIYTIQYNRASGLEVAAVSSNCTQPFVVYFSSKEKAQQCIDEFRCELEWYFTEYFRRLDEAC